MHATSPPASSRVQFSPGALLWLLPAALAIHAVAFWGTGLLDREGSAFIIDYLADRPIAAMVFDPWLNDWGTYQARELSYFVDYLDAQVFAALFAGGVLWLIPTSGVVGLIAIIWLYVRGARESWKLDRITSALLLSWFLSTIVVQSSTAIYYRSAKLLVAVCLGVLALLICRPLARPELRISFGRLLAIALVGAAMSVSDRQGFFFVALLLGLLVLWTLLTDRTDRPDLWRVGSLAAALLAAFVWGALYNYAVGPGLIYWLNGYWPDFSYQDIDIRALLTSGVWHQARVLVRRQAEFLTGGAALWQAAAFGVAVYVWSVATLEQPLRQRVRGVVRDVIVAAAAVEGVIVMTALMVTRHPYVYTIPDHSYWYYFLPAHVLFLVGVSLVIARVTPDLKAGHTMWHYATWVAIGTMIAGNISLYPEHRRVMVNSEWLKYQVARTDVIKRGWAGLQAGEVPPHIPRWVSLSPEARGARLRLPVPTNDLYPDTVRAALATRSGRSPLDDAPGPHWGALRDFFLDRLSPILRPGEWPGVLEGLRSVGIREVAIDPDKFEDPGIGAMMVEGIRGAGHHVIREHREDHLIVFTLADAPSPFREQASLRKLTIRAESVEVSHAPEHVPQLLDDDLNTRWWTGESQRGREWVQVKFDTPTNVARVRLDIQRRHWGDYPRALRIESEAGGDRTILWEGAGMVPLLRSILRQPLRPSVEIDLPSNHTDKLHIIQTGQADEWYWSAQELGVWERR